MTSRRIRKKKRKISISIDNMIMMSVSLFSHMNYFLPYVRLLASKNMYLFSPEKQQNTEGRKKSRAPKYSWAPEDGIPRIQVQVFLEHESLSFVAKYPIRIQVLVFKGARNKKQKQIEKIIDFLLFCFPFSHFFPFYLILHCCLLFGVFVRFFLFFYLLSFALVFRVKTSKKKRQGESKAWTEKRGEQAKIMIAKANSG